VDPFAARKSKPMKRIAALGLALTAALFACGGPVSAAEPLKITVGYGIGAEVLPVFVAKDRGYLDKHGLDVTLVAIAGPSNVPAALLSNSIQIGFNSPPSLLSAADNGLDLTIIAGNTRVVRGNETNTLVARTGSGIHSAADLKGKKVGVPGFGTGNDTMFRRWLTERKVSPDQLTIVEIPVAQMGDVLRGGTVDAVVVMEPVRSRIIASGVGENAANFYTDVNPNSISTFWAATGAWAKEHPDGVKAYRAALAEAIDYIKKNPDSARDIENKYLHFSSPRFPTYSLAIAPSDLQFYVDMARQMKMINNPVDPAKLIAP
jgi:NitT/TauT family transport system substrate-binding protein